MKPALLTLFLLALPRLAAAQTYTITDLSDVQGKSLHPGCINNRGQIAANFESTDDQDSAFLYRHGELAKIASPAGPHASISPYGLSRNGLVTGEFQLPSGDGPYHAYLLGRGIARDLGTLPGDAYSVGWGVNDSGEVVGSASASKEDGNEPRAFSYKSGKMTSLGALGGRSSTGVGINNKGEITGWAETSRGYGHEHAFLYRRGKMRDLGALPGYDRSTGMSINEHAQVTGEAQVSAHAHHAFLYAQGRMRDLGTLPGYHDSDAFSINNSAQIVGVATKFNGQPSHAFLYSGGKMADLNDLIPAGTGWVLETAASINDKGQIVGMGERKGERRGFLLTPKL